MGGLLDASARHLASPGISITGVVEGEEDEEEEEEEEEGEGDW